MIDACPDSAVLFFDVDGTLTSFDPDNMTDKDFSAVRPSQAVIEAFHRLRNAGHQAFICTGRPLWLIADGACGCRCHGGSDTRGRGPRGKRGLL